eukprot:2192039-Heterocapsa_arctica.AAC.1
MVRPPGPVVFPMKDNWNKANLSLEGKRASQLVTPGVNQLFGCPPDPHEANVGGDAGNDIAPLFDA